MLIQYTQIGSLDSAAQSRLKNAAASGTLQTNEAAQKYVVFEGKYFSLDSVQQLVSAKPQLLQG